MSSIYRKVNDNEPYTLDTIKDFEQHSCCDCGLVHNIYYEIISKTEITRTMVRNNRSTGQRRRQMRKRGEFFNILWTNPSTRKGSIT